MNNHDAEHAGLRELLGPYVLGGSDAADRIRLDRHLLDCAACRDELASYAGLPALLRLGRSQPASTAIEDDPEANEARLAAAVSVVRGERRRRRRGLLVAAAVLVVGVGATTFVAIDDGGPDLPTAERVELLPPAGSTSRGVSTLEPRPWGTSINLELSGLPEEEEFIAWVFDADRERQPAATWSSTDNGVAKVIGASSLSPDQISEIRITTTDGDLVLGGTG